MGHTSKCVANVMLVSQNARFGSKWDLSIRTKFQLIIIIIIYTTYIAPYIWPVWPFIGAEEGPSKY